MSDADDKRRKLEPKLEFGQTAPLTRTPPSAPALPFSQSGRPAPEPVARKLEPHPSLGGTFAATPRLPHPPTPLQADRPPAAAPPQAHPASTQHPSPTYQQPAPAPQPPPPPLSAAAQAITLERYALLAATASVLPERLDDELQHAAIDRDQLPDLNAYWTHRFKQDRDQADLYDELFALYCDDLLANL